jgi:hypothetical protein
MMPLKSMWIPVAQKPDERATPMTRTRPAPACVFALLACALGAPSLAANPGWRDPANSTQSSRAEAPSARATGRQRAASLNLDLGMDHVASASVATPAPGTRFRQIFEADRLELPELGGGTSRSAGRIEEFARRARREGLPLVRLWESHSALISLGLNAKGKPGLWIIQRLP